MNQKFYLTSLLGALLLTGIYSVLDTLLGFGFAWGNSLWALLSNFLVALILACYIVNSHRSGFRLGLEVFLIYFIIGHFNILIEAYIFNVTTRSQTMLELLRGLLAALAFSPVFTSMMQPQNKRPPRPLPGRSVLSWSWRVLASDTLYLFCYLSAGILLSILYPRLLTFYEGKLPAMGTMIATQFFLRGLIFTGVALLMLQSTTLPLFRKAVLIGITFSVLGGIAPLIPPNELMPAFVRLGHGLEVGISNFLFGLLIAFLLGYGAGTKTKASKAELS